MKFFNQTYFISSIQNIAIFLTAAGLLTTFIFQFSLSSINYNERRKDKLKSSEVTKKASNIGFVNVMKNVELYKVCGFSFWNV